MTSTGGGIVYGKSRALRTSMSSLLAVVSIFILGALAIAFGGAVRSAHAEINHLTALVAKQGAGGGGPGGAGEAPSLRRRRPPARAPPALAAPPRPPRPKDLINSNAKTALTELNTKLQALVDEVGAAGWRAAARQRACGCHHAPHAPPPRAPCLTARACRPKS